MGLIKNQQIEITNWLNSDRNYDDGVFLYQKYGKNPVLKRLFPGREKFQAEKLAYELGKLIGLGFNQTLEIQEPDNKQVPDSGSDETTPNPTNTQSTDKKMLKILPMQPKSIKTVLKNFRKKQSKQLTKQKNLPTKPRPQPKRSEPWPQVIRFLPVTTLR